jgi:hypothetical protein
MKLWQFGLLVIVLFVVSGLYTHCEYNYCVESGGSPEFCAWVVLSD